MKKIYLHIGTGKTGTSTIQNALHAHRKELREKYSVDYADVSITSIEHFGETIVAHYPLVEVIKSRNERALRKVLDYINKSNCRSIVFSCESLYHNLNRNDIEWLDNGLLGNEVFVICYVRRQDLYIESAYRQQVKVGEFKMRFEDFVKRHTQSRFLNEVHANYYRMIGVWASIFGKKNVTVRPFDKKIFRNGSLLDDFSHILGVDDTFLSKNMKNETNQTLPSELINIIRLCNSYQVVPRDEQQGFVQFLRSSFEFRDGVLLEQEERDHVLNNYLDCNNKLCDEYGIPKEWFSSQLPHKVSVSIRSEEAVSIGLLYSLYRRFSKPSRSLRVKVRTYFFIKDLFWLLKNAHIKSSNDGKSSELGVLRRLRLVASGSFSPTYYLSRYPDVREAGVDPFVHYKNNGRREHRLPHPTYSRSI